MKNDGITFDTVRAIGLALPRAAEDRYYGMPALKIDGEVFVVQTSHRSADPNSISVVVGFKHRDELIAADPRVYYLKRHYQSYPVVLVRLDSIDRAELRRLLRGAYAAVSSGNVLSRPRRQMLRGSRSSPKRSNESRTCVNAAS